MCVSVCVISTVHDNVQYNIRAQNNPNTDLTTYRHFQSKRVQNADTDKPHEQRHNEIDHREPVHVRDLHVVVLGSIVRDGRERQPHLKYIKNGVLNAHIL